MGITTDSEISDGKDREYPFTNQDFERIKKLHYHPVNRIWSIAALRGACEPMV